MPDIDIKDGLERSLYRQKQLLRGSLILNPVENYPFPDDLKVVSSEIHGLYNSDKVRNDEQKINTIHQFGGRQRLAYDSKKIYRSWSEVLRAEDLSMRLLSGLQSHAVIFMSIANPGDSVLLLPESGGGHMATKSILERLGLNIVEMALDREKMKVDVESTLLLARHIKPDFVFVDRSEGLNYEDFSWVNDIQCKLKIFDCSQYLSHIIVDDFKNPFDMGFDLIVSTIHKNFPGPQKALVATKVINKTWKQIQSGLSTYVSNMHTFSTYAAGMTISRMEWLQEYSAVLLHSTEILDSKLKSNGVRIVERNWELPQTHHIWISASSREEAYNWFRKLERNRIYTNYRKLPYDKGYGLRLGLQALVRLGASTNDCVELADIITEALNTQRVKTKVRCLAHKLWKNYES